jgi:hypothetical protein
MRTAWIGPVECDIRMPVMRRLRMRGVREMIARVKSGRPALAVAAQRAAAEQFDPAGIASRLLGYLGEVAQ